MLKISGNNGTEEIGLVTPTPEGSEPNPGYVLTLASRARYGYPGP